MVEGAQVTDLDGRAVPATPISMTTSRGFHRRDRLSQPREGGREYDAKTNMLIPTALSLDDVANVRTFVWMSLAAKAERCDAASHHGSPVAPRAREAP